MITEQDLQEAIAECEGARNPNANTCIKLAAFYTIRNEMFRNQKSEPVVNYSFSSAPKSGYESDSEFGNLIAGKDTQDYMPAVDELISTVQVLNPRLYEAFMKKMRAL